MRQSINYCLSMLLTLVMAGSAFTQKPNRFEDAIERSQDAARIITILATLPDSGFPKELVDKAEAIGVFPKVTRETVGFTHVTQGYGVISARQGTSWTMPAFYQFGGGGYGNPFARAESNGVILLFMSKDALGWFEKGGVKLRNEKSAIGGPVGVFTKTIEKEIEGAQVLAYAYYNGKLSGTAFGKSFWKSFGLNPDNKINNPLYGVKGREVLAGATIDAAKLPQGISNFHDALDKYYARP